MPPAAKAGLAGVIAIETSPDVEPVPDKLTICGLLLPLSVTVRIPVREPTTAGVNVTLIVHLFPAPAELPQVLVWAKSPTTAMLVMESAVVRLLVSVTDTGGLVVPTVRLENVIVAGVRPTAARPVPVVGTACGLLLALSVIVTVPLASPVTEGLKVTEMMHFFPLETEPPQVLVTEKFALATILVIASVALPVLVRVTFLTALLKPTTVLPNVKLVGESETVCAAVVTVSSKIQSPKVQSMMPDLPTTGVPGGLPSRRMDFPLSASGHKLSLPHLDSCGSSRQAGEPLRQFAAETSRSQNIVNIQGLTNIRGSHLRKGQKSQFGLESYIR